MVRSWGVLTVVILSGVLTMKAIDAGQLSELLGYTVIACTNASGELEGADFDKLVKLDNGMVFEFQTYSYFYSYHPDVVVFAKTVEYQGRSVTLYKMLIGGERQAKPILDDSKLWAIGAARLKRWV
jgi:hypothetical protein